MDDEKYKNLCMGSVTGVHKVHKYVEVLGTWASETRTFYIDGKCIYKGHTLGHMQGVPCLHHNCIRSLQSPP